MNDIRLLVLDIDGTIAGRSNQVTAGVREAVAAVQAKGIQVAIATGRMYQAAVRFHTAIGSTLPLIAYQGALIKDPISGQVYRHTPLSRKHTLVLLEELSGLEAQQKLSIHLYIDDQLYVRTILTETQDYAERSGVEPLAVGDLASFLQDQQALEATKLLALSPEPALVIDILTRLKQTYAPEDLYLTQSVETFFEATHPLSNKGTAVQFLAENLLELPREQVMTIGDNFNDLEMLRYAQIGVAMGDAPPAVKKHADWIAPSVEEDGVVAAINHFLEP